MSRAVLRSEVEERVALITLDRPEVLNALNGELMSALGEAIAACEADPEVGAIVLTGNERAFAAGADIAEMVERDFATMYLEDHFAATWERVASCRKPVIAAVRGYALGGGCELAMMCDLVIAGEGARFGQPEVKLGVLPGLGGTQRLTRLVGKAKAMDLCLTGRMMGAVEAERCGLVSRVVPDEQVLEEALGAARTIAAMSQPAVRMIKESVNRALETTLAEGIRFERRLFHAAFALEDQGEGMRAFLDKRKPRWRHR